MSSEPPQSPKARRPSLAESFLSARPPSGVLAATGEVIGKAPSVADLRRESLGGGRRRSSMSGQSRRESSASATSPSGANISPARVLDSDPIPERRSEDVRQVVQRRGEVDEAVPQPPFVEKARSESQSSVTAGERAFDSNEPQEKHDWWSVAKSGLLAFWGWFLTIKGFLIAIYMLNVIAWGGMLFLLLCNAAPAMCNPDCNDINSPRRIWIEIDSQILNALFCVTGFGLVPWRFRDLYYLLQWRLLGKSQGYSKLQEIHGNWFRPGPLQDDGEHQAPTQPTETETGERAPATKTWKLDYVIWLYCWNTFFQCCLSGFMWGMNRYNRPPWTTGLFVGLACGVAIMAGAQVWWESRKVKRVEGDSKTEEEKKVETNFVTG